MQRIIPRQTPVQPNSEQGFCLPGAPSWLMPLLLSRGICTREAAENFFAPSAVQVNDPFLLHDMDRATDLIKEAKRESRRAVVYGDYDVDGICASAIMLKTLREFGVTCVPYIPDRHQEGYGLNLKAVEELAAQAGLLITVDCGITSVAEVARAKELGMAVIVTDHHTLPDTLPGADALIDPLMPPYPFPGLCGAGVAWQLRRALLGPESGGACLDLAALATVADMVPLTDENRAIVSLGLDALAKTGRPGLKALMADAGIRPGGPVTGEQVAFQLAPRMNASGRLESAMTALELLTTDDPGRAEELAFELNRLNSLRKNAESAVLREAEQSLLGMDLCRLRAIVVCGQGFDSGVVGLAAGRLAEKYGYPAVVLAAKEDLAVGSARSVEGVDIYQALYEVRDLFLRFGGHRQAAGMTLRLADVPEFRERLSAAIARQLDGKIPMPQAVYDAELPLSQVDGRAWEWLKKLEPCGMANPQPVFYLRNVQVDSARAVGAEQAHLKLALRQGTVRRFGIAFRQGQMAALAPRCADILYSPARNEFNGSVTYECKVSLFLPDAQGLEPDRVLLADAAMRDLLLAADLTQAGPADAGEPLPPDEEGQGLLIFCRTRETAARMRAGYRHFDFLTGQVRDPRAYNAVAVGMPLSAVRAPYRRVWLADGDLTGLDAALYDRSQYPDVRVTALNDGTGPGPLTGSLLITRAELGTLYRALPQADNEQSTLGPEALARKTGLTVEQTVAGLSLLRELGLIAWEAGRPGIGKPAGKPSGLRLEEMPVFRLIEARKGAGEWHTQHMKP